MLKRQLQYSIYVECWIINVGLLGEMDDQLRFDDTPQKWILRARHAEVLQSRFAELVLRFGIV